MCDIPGTVLNLNNKSPEKEDLVWTGDYRATHGRRLGRYRRIPWDSVVCFRGSGDFVRDTVDISANRIMTRSETQLRFGECISRFLERLELFYRGAARNAVVLLLTQTPYSVFRPSCSFLLFHPEIKMEKWLAILKQMVHGNRVEHVKHNGRFNIEWVRSTNGALGTADGFLVWGGPAVECSEAGRRVAKTEGAQRNLKRIKTATFTPMAVGRLQQRRGMRFLRLYYYTSFRHVTVANIDKTGANNAFCLRVASVRKKNVQ